MEDDVAAAAAEVWVAEVVAMAVVAPATALSLSWVLVMVALARARGCPRHVHPWKTCPNSVRCLSPREERFDCGVPVYDCGVPMCVWDLFLLLFCSVLLCVCVCMCVCVYVCMCVCMCLSPFILNRYTHVHSLLTTYPHM